MLTLDMSSNSKALILVDIQYDFLPPDGSLAVPDGDAILLHVYELLEHAEQYDIVVASMVTVLLTSPLPTYLNHSRIVRKIKFL
jgi:nicotinamidase-related amidase